MSPSATASRMKTTDGRPCSSTTPIQLTVERSSSQTCA
jgi:hypothetical protein